MTQTISVRLLDYYPEEWIKRMKADALTRLADTVFTELYKDKAHKYVVEISEREEPTLEAVEYTLQCRTFIVEQRDVTEWATNNMAVMAMLEDRSIKILWAKLSKELSRRIKNIFTNTKRRK